MSDSTLAYCRRGCCKSALCVPWFGQSFIAARFSCCCTELLGTERWCVHRRSQVMLPFFMALHLVSPQMYYVFNLFSFNVNGVSVKIFILPWFSNEKMQLFYIWFIEVLFVGQCGDTCKPWNPLGYPWSFWEKEFTEGIKWG